jgi:hypothetical protein
MKNQTLSLLTAAAACAALFAGLGVTFNAASAAIITDAVPTGVYGATPSNNVASITRTIDSMVTVTGANLSIVQPGNANVDPTAAAWGGNLLTYVIYDLGTDAAGGGLGNVTYAAVSGNYFTDFDARIVGNTGQIGPNASDVLSVYKFEGSTDGVNFSSIAVTGTKITGTGLDADWSRVSAVPTDLGALGQVTHLRIGINPKASGGDWWHQQFGAVSLNVAPVPEPSSLLLLGMGGLLMLVVRRRR